MTAVEYRKLLTNATPEKSLMRGIHQRKGRSAMFGRITTRHRGGGAKRKYRFVDFKQDKFNIQGNVVSCEYDPFRTAFIMLIHYKDGEKRYLLAPYGIKVGDIVVTSEKTDPTPGNRMRLAHIPVGVFIHNIEFIPGGGGKIVKAAGTFARVLSKDAGFVHVELPSTEIRKFPEGAFASIGQLSNFENAAVTIGKAGRARHMGRRPTVRGSAMNPVDHPHGGGEGKAPIGLKYPKTPWGKHALGVKTRKKRKYSNRFIVERRKKKT